VKKPGYRGEKKGSREKEGGKSGTTSAHRLHESIGKEKKPSLPPLNQPTKKRRGKRRIGGRRGKSRKRGGEKTKVPTREKNSNVHPADLRQGPKRKESRGGRKARKQQLNTKLKNQTTDKKGRVHRPRGQGPGRWAVGVHDPLIRPFVLGQGRDVKGDYFPAGGGLDLGGTRLRRNRGEGGGRNQRKGKRP